MSDIVSSPKKIQVEESDERAPVSESLLQKMGGSINYILDQADAQAVGSYDFSRLSEAQYQAQRGTGWILADGRNVAGSRYATITGNTTVPDARGLFMRMKDFSTAVTPNVSGRNPAGNLALNSLQLDEFTQHAHGVTSSNSPYGMNQLLTTKLEKEVDEGGEKYNVDGFLGVNFSVNANGSSTETRPRNITLNVFIRIN